MRGLAFLAVFLTTACAGKWDYRVAGVFAEGRIHQPMGLAVSGDRLYVSDTVENVVAVIDLHSGNLLDRWPAGSGTQRLLERPVGLAWGNDSLYVADAHADQVVRMSSEGEVRSAWGESGEASGQLDTPYGVAVSPDGHVFVAEFYNHRISVFGPDGEFRKSLGSQGRGRGEFNYPTALTFDEKGNLYVADAYNHRIQKFDTSGRYERKWGSWWGIPLAFKGWFNAATGVAAGPGPRVAAVDEFNGRIQMTCDYGLVRAVLGKGVLKHPTASAIGPDGRIYVADFGHNRIVVFEQVGRTT